MPRATAELARWTYELGGRPRDVVAAYRYAALVGDPEPTLDYQDEENNHDAVCWLTLEEVDGVLWLPALGEPVRRLARGLLGGAAPGVGASPGSARPPD